MPINILGISAYYHDSAACLIVDGDICAAAQEERFTRKKHDSKFPKNAISYCLKEAGIDLSQLNHVVFYDKPLLKFDRLLETYLAYAPRGLISYLMSMPLWLKDKLFLKSEIKKELANLIKNSKKSPLPPILFSQHHQSHAASAFYPSPFERAGILIFDGVGEWATTSAWLGEGNSLRPLWEIDFPHSLGLLYSAFTYYTGFRVNSGEYKLMGLAPYGEPKYSNLIYDHLIDLKEDGTFRLNMEYFNFAVGLTMTTHKFHKLFGGPPRKPESPITQREMDLARSVQQVTEEIVLRLAKTIHQELKVDYLCLAGGVALNCVANGRLLREGPFKDIWIQPAAGDAGGAIGAALGAWHEYYQKARSISTLGIDQMKGSYLGPQMKKNEIREYLDSIEAKYQELDEKTLYPTVAGILAEGNVVGWCQGRMEFGPRALGGRSILGDSRNSKMQSVMNLKIKFRESFRPFAPAVLHEKVSDYFELQHSSPYMLLVAPVKKSLRIPIPAEKSHLFGIDQLNIPRSQIPAVTHVDYSARVQTIHPETNQPFYSLLKEFEKQTGCGVLVNTSFNVRGEPIVCTAEDAYRCFMRTEMDYLILENFVIAKQDQPKNEANHEWQKEFALD